MINKLYVIHWYTSNMIVVKYKDLYMKTLLMESSTIGESPGESLKTGTRSNVYTQFVWFSPYSKNH